MASSYVPSYHDLEVTFSEPQTSKSGKATVHYVEAGDPNLPKVLLLHGFPSSSHQYRDFIPMLSDSYHVLAPDYPGFGLTQVSDDFVYRFDNITAVMAAWLRAINVEKAVIFIQDFGAPVGLRLAITGGVKPTAIVTQNGNAYTEGLGQATFGPLRTFWDTGSAELRQKIAEKMLTLEGSKQRIIQGTPDKDIHLIDPQMWTLCYLQNMAGPAKASNMLDYLYDYRTNVDLYPAFQKYIRESKVPILAVWGKGDPSFIPPGAEAFRKDSPDAAIHFVDAGHFALETARWETARLMRDFLAKNLH